MACLIDTFFAYLAPLMGQVGAFVADDVGLVIENNCGGGSLMTQVWPREICAASWNERDGRHQDRFADVEHIVIHISRHELLIIGK
ncbi:hypothetical protein QBC45DRAFT_16087 [Copromyces sp. CBS 386.78]|nr:hypothetical protein QBC45DRAFT_16087 [Copromyces sp. CBS 386.78]